MSFQEIIKKKWSLSKTSNNQLKVYQILILESLWMMIIRLKCHGSHQTKKILKREKKKEFYLKRNLRRKRVPLHSNWIMLLLFMRTHSILKFTPMQILSQNLELSTGPPKICHLYSTQSIQCIPSSSQIPTQIDSLALVKERENSSCKTNTNMLCIPTTSILKI